MSIKEVKVVMVYENGMETGPSFTCEENEWNMNMNYDMETGEKTVTLKWNKKDGPG